MSTPQPQQPAAPPKTHPGERLADYFDSFFKTIVAVSTLGASITFAKIVQTPVTPWIDYGFSKITIQNYLGLSWLFFVLDLAITSFAASALSLYRPQAIEYFGIIDSHRRRIVMWYATAVFATLFGLLIAAFVFLSLVVTALTGPSGWTALGFTSLFGTLGVASIVWQSPIGSKPPPSEDDILRRRTRPHGYPSPSPGRRQDSMGPILTGDPSYYDYNGTPTKGQYTGDGLSRRPTVTRPVSDVVPPYTVDLRRMRASRTYDDERHIGSDEQVEEQFATINALDMLTYDGVQEKYDEKDQSIHTSGDDPRYIPAYRNTRQIRRT
jgi:hypothetical protein